MRPYDSKIDREVPVIVADNSLHVQMEIGTAFASRTSGVLRGVVLIDDIQNFIGDRHIEGGENICYNLAEACGVYGMINGFKSHFGKRDFSVWRPEMITRNDFVMKLDGETSKLDVNGGWIHPAIEVIDEMIRDGKWGSPKSDPLKDILAMADEIKAEHRKLDPPPSLPIPSPPFPPLLPLTGLPPSSDTVDSWDLAPINPISRPNVNIPEGALVALMMMLGEKEITIREEDMLAAERWREGVGLRMFVQHDPYSFIVKLEE